MRVTVQSCLLTVQLVLLLVLWSPGTVLCAQTITIRLVNGKNGRAIANTCVNTWVGTERKDAMAIPTDKDGVASLRLTDKDAEINTQDRTACGSYGVVNPVVTYANSIQINAGYVLCEVRKSGYTWLAIQKFSTEEVLHSGVVTANTCGKAKALPKPGQITIFVRPLNLWEKLKE